MFSKFKNGEKVVIVKGIGKENGKFYYEEKGKVINRDPYYKDYNILFKDGKSDWFDEIYIRKRRKRKNGNKKYKNRRF